MAVKRAKGELKLNESFRREGLLGMIFTGHAIEETELYGNKAIVSTIGGQAWIYGYSQYVLDETDPFPNGYTVGDIW
jgi:proline racemase